MHGLKPKDQIVSFSATAATNPSGSSQADLCQWATKYMDLH